MYFADPFLQWFRNRYSFFRRCFRPVVFCTVLYCLHSFFRNSCFTLASQCSCNPELPNHGSTVAVMGKLQMAMPYERLCQINCKILKISGVKCLMKVYKTSDPLPVCKWEVFLWCKGCLFKAGGDFCCCYN